jgi:hypothetical protein
MVQVTVGPLLLTQGGRFLSTNYAPIVTRHSSKVRYGTAELMRGKCEGAEAFIEGRLLTQGGRF